MKICRIQVGPCCFNRSWSPRIRSKPALASSGSWDKTEDQFKGGSSDQLAIVQQRWLAVLTRISPSILAMRLVSATSSAPASNPKRWRISSLPSIRKMLPISAAQCLLAQLIWRSRAAFSFEESCSSSVW